MATTRFSKTEFVDLIINGFGETADNMNLLFGVNTLTELRKRMNRFAYKFNQNSAAVKTPSGQLSCNTNGIATNKTRFTCSD